jgi:hypothetical protein
MRFLDGAEGEGFEPSRDERPERLSRPQAFSSTMEVQAWCATERATVRFRLDATLRSSEPP